QNSGSRSHIAVVSDVVAPSGRYMIVHNRGWGPQIEDGLFVDEITGHYRYTGEGPSRPPESLIVARAPAVATVKVRTTDVAAIAPAPPVQTPAITVTAARAPSALRTGGKLSRAPQAAEPGRRSVAQGRVTAGRLAESVAAVPTTRLVQRRVAGASESGIRTDFGLSR
ncbi:MAG: DUF1287 domain-containing protein, partial [Verrucomicrobiae bacterium]|nr:DUF1287 domain-containing protein [Verrucomicrobiae bacterium]